MTEQHFIAHCGQAQLYHEDYSCLPKNKNIQATTIVPDLLSGKDKKTRQFSDEVLTASLGKAPRFLVHGA